MKPVSTVVISVLLTMSVQQAAACVLKPCRDVEDATPCSTSCGPEQKICQCDEVNDGISHHCTPDGRKIDEGSISDIWDDKQHATKAVWSCQLNCCTIDVCTDKVPPPGCDPDSENGECDWCAGPPVNKLGYFSTTPVCT